MLLWSTLVGRTGVPIVILPGAYSNAHDLPLNFVARLTGPYGRQRVLLLDHRESGQSLWRYPTPYTLDDMADDVLDVLDAHNFERASLLGISMGGAIAQRLAVRAPERVHSLSLLMTTPGRGIWDDDLPRPSSRVLDGMQREIACYQRRELRRGLIERWATHGSRADERRVVRVLRQGLNPSAQHAQALRSSPSRVETLGEIRCPTRIVHGRQDEMFPLPHAEALRDGISGATLRVVESAGHDIEEANAHAWADALM
ncbi:MAG: alpha/beta hydrolase, partial [Actinomycetota bacterium]|nr:alpha/beta hydrolase [Actinomycetota bacterium]